MSTDANQNLIDKIQTLIDLGVGENGRLEHIKKTIILGNQLYESDKNYLHNLLQKYSLADTHDTTNSSTSESEQPKIIKSTPPSESKKNENITKTSNKATLNDKKGLGLTTILAFLIMGVGHIYVGKVKRGVILLVIGIILSTLSSVLIGIGELYDGEYLTDSNALVFYGVGGAVGLSVFILWIWQIFNARTACKQYNNQLE